MDFDHYYARCIRSISPPRDQYVGYLRTTSVPQKTHCGRFVEATQVTQASPSHSITSDTSAMKDSNDTCLPNETCEPVMADSIKPVALESWENMLASDNCAVLTEFLLILERTRINGNVSFDCN